MQNKFSYERIGPELSKNLFTIVEISLNVISTTKEVELLIYIIRMYG